MALQPTPAPYLQYGRSLLQGHQDSVINQLGHTWIHNFERVLHQVGDVHLPVGPQHGDHLIGALAGGSVELRENLHLGSLVLQSAATAHLPLIFVVIVTVASRPVWEENLSF